MFYSQGFFEGKAETREVCSASIRVVAILKGKNHFQKSHVSVTFPFTEELNTFDEFLVLKKHEEVSLDLLVSL